MTRAALDLLHRRVAQLDSEVAVFGSAGDGRLIHAASELQSFTNTEMAAAAGTPAVIEDVGEADAIAGTSHLLAALDREVPAIVSGPLDGRAQEWVGTARAGAKAPAPAHFAVPARSDPPATSPWSSGLYTSSGSRLGPSMWRAYLDLYRGSDLFPLPWQVWSLPAATSPSRIREITSAADWAALVERYPRPGADVIYPDWAAAAGDGIDAVHLTLRAVVAVQGFSFPTRSGLSAPGFWDVETTLWLRWAFDRPRLIDVVEQELPGR